MNLSMNRKKILLLAGILLVTLFYWLYPVYVFPGQPHYHSKGHYGSAGSVKISRIEAVLEGYEACEEDHAGFFFIKKNYLKNDHARERYNESKHLKSGQ